MDSGKPCPLDGAPSEVLPTSNDDYPYQCIKCGNRFNEAGEIQPRWDDESVEESDVERP